ncbi:tetratricopeptide repeat protein [Flavobacterium sp. DGU11]|uniref:Tetratricopeptide repeat protein n=1 Tax=Flavobacterium arundinis TaxID=3139143 RepID=A0ABU9HYQ6_9FLAO
MKNVLAALVFGLCSTAYSQVDYSAVYDGNAFLAEGIRLYDEQKYADAIKQFDKIVTNDPKYYTAQYEKAMALAAGEDKEAANAFYENAYVKGYMAEVPDFYMSYGNFLSDRKEYDKSEKMFLEAQKLFPNSSSLLYNMALLYVRKEERQKSVDFLEKAIMINPNHAGSHYLLGLIALEDGRAVEGTMALLAYLTLVPESSASPEIIKKLNAKFADNYLDKNKLVFSKAGGDNFEDIDVVLRNSLPLRSVYKVNSEFDDIIIRQVQAIIDYAPEHKVENGFFETTYIPWLADMSKKKQFEGFSYYILLGMKEKLGKKLTSQNKKIEAFTDGYIANDFWDVFAKRKIDLFGKQEEVVVYLQNGKPYLLGKIVNGKKEGKYKVLNASGNMVSELNFANDKIEGLQKYYDYKGRLIEEKYFTDGKLNGKRTTYFDNGNIELAENYKDDKLHGISTSYYLNGGKACEGNFINGERDGTLTCLYENGTKKSEDNYLNGKLNGKYIVYDKAGNVSSEDSFVMEKREGKAFEYYNGKVLKSEIDYKGGIISSPLKKYFPDGTLQEETIFANNIPTNGVINFANGKKSYEIIYDKTGNPATYNYYNTNTELYFQENYKNNEIKSGLQYTAGNAKPVDVPVNKGAYSIKTIDGKIITTGKFEKSRKTGEWSYFYANGILRSKDNYQNGLQSGKSFSYNDDGRLASIVNYVNDSLQGVYERYDYGVLSGSYYYNRGNANGPAKFFYSDGSLSSESFYINDELQSKRYDYWQNGNPSEITTYKDGTAIKMETFDTDGKKENEVDYKNNNSKIKNLYYKGTLVHEYTLTNGTLNGTYTIKDKTGSIYIQCNYANGIRHGKYLKNGPTGAPLLDKDYYSGQENGTSKIYDIAGNLRIVDTYIFGDNTGTTIRYYNNKNKFSETTQYDDEKEGEVKYYNLKGDNILILGYQRNQLVYYITMGKDGKLTDKKPVAAQTAKIVSVYPNGKNAIELNYVSGNMDGRFLVSSPEGKPEYESNYDKGLLTGLRAEYYANGKVYKKENFKNSSFEGLQEFFKEDGKPWVNAEYKNDQMHGLCKIYNNGTISQTKRYDSDVLVEIK